MTACVRTGGRADAFLSVGNAHCLTGGMFQSLWSGRVDSRPEVCPYSQQGPVAQENGTSQWEPNHQVSIKNHWEPD